ncbi:hypothetical protein ACSBR1_035355 [Camellia fascicularis]
MLGGGDIDILEWFASLTTVFKVLVAATSKMFHKWPNEADRLYEISGVDLHLEPHTRRLRYLSACSNYKIQPIKQGCNYITNKASRRTTDKQMETLKSHRSRRNQTHHMNDPFMHHFHFLRGPISHQQHILRGASKPHEPQARPHLNSHSNPPLVPRPRKTRIHQPLLQTRH